MELAATALCRLMHTPVVAEAMAGTNPAPRWMRSSAGPTAGVAMQRRKVVLDPLLEYACSGGEHFVAALLVRTAAFDRPEDPVVASSETLPRR